MKAFRLKYIKLTDNIRQSLRGFFYGEVYLALIALITVIAYASNQSASGIIALSVLAVIVLLLYGDLTPFTILPMVFMLNLRSWNTLLSPAIIVSLFFVFIALILHFILFPTKFKKGRLFLPIIIVSIALILGGIFADGIFGYYLNGLVSRLATGPAVLIVYLVFMNGFNPPERFDAKKYFCKILTVLGLICFFELLIYQHLLSLEIEGVEIFDIGWNNLNGVASLILLTIPAAFYLLVKSKKFVIWAIAIALLYRALYLTNSDGCLGVSLVALPVLCVYALIYADKNLKYRLSCIFIVACVSACAFAVKIFLETGTLPLVDKIKENIFVDSGRTAIYKDALNLFFKHPIFGVGIGYSPDDPKLETSLILAYNFHSTFFHVIATMGTIGLLSYAYYFYKRYQVLMHDNGAFNTFMVASFTFMEAYGMIDTCEFNIMPVMLVATILIAVVEINNGRTELPLKKRQANRLSF